MNDDGLSHQLDSLRREHRALDELIAAMLADPAADQLEIARLKKRKLQLKDQIAVVADLIVPDIIA